MGTERRLKKLVREEAKKLGHDLGYWIKKPDGSWYSECVNCGLPAGIFINDDIDSKFVHNARIARHIDINDIKWRSGVSWKEVHPTRGKGTISGAILSLDCKKKT